MKQSRPARELWLEKQERRRTALALLAVALGWALVLSALVLAGWLVPDELAQTTGPVLIRVGVPKGFDAPRPEDPLPEPPPEPEPEQSLPQQPPPEPVQPDVPPDPAALLPALPSPANTPPPPTPRPSRRPEQSPARVAATPRAAASAPPASVSAAPTSVPVVIRGQEAGNSYETTLEGGSGRIGRALYVPIHLFLPLPASVGEASYNKISAKAGGLETADSRKAVFRTYYERQGLVWRLKADIPFAQRPQLWGILESAGYDLTKAEYKAGRSLRPVVLEFRVGAAAAGAVPVLESVRVVSSSGYSDVDEAVVYGFSQASFYNDNARSATGRFTYRFDR